MPDAARDDRYEQPASAIRLPAYDAERTASVAASTAPLPAGDELASSWLRCANRHALDPLDSRPPRILSRHELNDIREPLGSLVFGAQEEIDRLHKVTREAEYTVLLCDRTGVAVEHRCEDGQTREFEHSGLWLGSLWSEATEGTNGIGTCIAEERAVTVHRSQHFKMRHVNVSCSGAPIFGMDGRLMAVLAVAAVDPLRSERARALTGALAVSSARAVEERFFREQFRHEWIIAIASSAGDAHGMLLAVDSGQRILGANRAARTSLSLDDRRLQAGVCLWTIFERKVEAFRHKEGRDVAAHLVLAGSSDARHALVTPPARCMAAWHDSTDGSVHARPRLDAIDSLVRMTPPAPVCGGLTPLAVRRVQEYVQAKLDDSIDLETLASVAGVSKCHFVRTFKKSIGTTPHRYLIQKRVEQAREMLAHTDRSLSEIAFAVGFADQSHMGHHFHQLYGITPGKFRALHRQRRADATGAGIAARRIFPGRQDPQDRIDAIPAVPL